MARIILLLLLSTTLQAQQSDILLLKKNNRTVRHFFAGTQIEFYTTEKTWISAVVDSIRRDSLYLRYYDARMVPTAFGGMKLDTLGVYPMYFSLANVYSFPAKNSRGNIFTNGALLKVGGGAYLPLNLINTLREKDPYFGKDNLPHIVGGASAVLVGYLLGKTHRTEYRLGKKYKLQYLPAVVQ